MSNPHPWNEQITRCFEGKGGGFRLQGFRLRWRDNQRCLLAGLGDFVSRLIGLSGLSIEATWEY